MKKMIILEEKEKIYIDVYHIGYSKQGEGSLFILYTDTGKVLYSLAIDCYEESQCNETRNILKYWKLEKKLNMFIWTHPHDDHSIGVKEIIQTFCNNNSVICIANILSLKEKCSDVCKKNIEYIQTLTSRKTVKNKWHINSMVHFPEIMDEVYFNGECEIKKLVVQCISPVTELGGMEAGKKNPDFNMMSIGCIVKIKMKDQNINFLFAGDMEHYTIEKLIEEESESIPNIYNYIKIPHHGSENAENMIEYLGFDNGMKSEFASVSVFVKHGLPKRKVLDTYRNVVEQIGCTSDINTKNYGLGVIRLRYDLEARRVLHRFYGTATFC